MNATPQKDAADSAQLPLEFSALLKRIISGESLSSQEMYGLMQLIMQGQMGDTRMGALLTALSIKGETSREISAAAQAMRDLMYPVAIAHPSAVDIVGTGGDGANLFNVSTAASFVAAAAGVTVAKHGNRSVSSSSGSADLLESAGIFLGLNNEQVARCIDEVGIGFMFAPNHHPAMRFAAPVRRDLGIKTLFNVLGPLTNPAGVHHQVIGVYDKRLVSVLAEAFQHLNSQHALVVHSAEGLDELSIAGSSFIAELKAGDIHHYTITPESVGLQSAPLDSLKVNTTAESLQRVMSALGNEAGPARDMVALNAGAAIYAADQAVSLKEGVSQALSVMASGEALKKLHQLAEFTQQFA